MKIKSGDIFYHIQYDMLYVVEGQNVLIMNEEIPEWWRSCEYQIGDNYGKDLIFYGNFNDE